MPGNPEKWLARYGPDIMKKYLDKTEVVYPNGLRRNRVFRLERALEGRPSFAEKIVQAVGNWAVRNSIGVLTATAPATSLLVRKVSQKLQIPCVVYKRPQDELSFLFDRLDGLTALEAGAPFGLVHDVRTTGNTMRTFAQKLGYRPARALTIVNQGQAMPGIKTLDECRRYSRENPDQEPAHVALPFKCDELMQCPMPYYVAPAAEQSNSRIATS